MHIRKKPYFLLSVWIINKRYRTNVVSASIKVIHHNCHESMLKIKTMLTLWTLFYVKSPKTLGLCSFPLINPFMLRLHGDLSPKFIFVLLLSPDVFSSSYRSTSSFDRMHGNIQIVTYSLAAKWLVTHHSKQQDSFDVLVQIHYHNAIITCRSHSNIWSITYCLASKKMMTHRSKQQFSVQLSDDPNELILTVKHEYYSRESTGWEMKTMIII